VRRRRRPHGLHHHHCQRRTTTARSSPPPPMPAEPPSTATCGRRAVACLAALPCPNHHLCRSAAAPGHPSKPSHLLLRLRQTPHPPNPKFYPRRSPARRGSASALPLARRLHLHGQPRGLDSGEMAGHTFSSFLCSGHGLSGMKK
jgi:hypothetical protein